MQPAKPAAFFLRVGIRHIGDENIKDKERIKNMDRIYGNESGISYCYDNGGVTFYQIRQSTTSIGYDII